MKPIKLKIKGLNSFIDEQVIDFEKLTEKGLFGIFGSTGSGKSTILDALTIALYGKIARESTDYINTNCDRLIVSYEFEIGDGKERKRYAADRCVRKDKHGAYKTAYARLIEKGSDGEDKIIAEKTTDVKNAVEEIIGLTVEDFTRSVVLPQGKFSEFLKLRGKDRRNMLERIFRLEKYGKKLGEKIRTARNIQLTEKNILIGELKKYEGLSEEIYKDIKDELKTLNKEEKELNEEKKKIDSDYEKYKDIWSLQNELNIYANKQKQLNERTDEISNEKEKLNNAKNALKIKPFIDNLNETEKKIYSNEKKLKSIQIQLNKVDEKLEITEKEYNKAQKNKDDKIPVLVKKEANLTQAIELHKKIEKLEKEKQELLKNYSGLKKDKVHNEKNLNDVIDKRKECTENEKRNNIRIQDIKVEPEYREKVQSALQKENEYKESIKNKKEINDNINIKNAEIEKLQNNHVQILKVQNEQNNKVILIEEKLKNLQKNFPGDNKLLLQKQNNLNKLNEELNEVLKNNDKREELDGKLKKASISKLDCTEKLSKINEQFKSNEELLKSCEKEIEDIENNNRAAILAAKLEEGEPCPVCGSIHHINIAHEMDFSVLDEKKKLKKDLEANMKQLDKTVRQLEQQLAAFEKEEENLKDELELLSKKLNGINVAELKKKKHREETEFDNLKSKIINWNKEKENHNSSYLKEKDEKSKVDTEEARLSEALKNKKSSLIELQKQLAVVDEKHEEISKDYFHLRDKLALEDINAKMNEIKSSEKEISKLQKLQLQLRENIDKYDKAKEESAKNIAQLDIQITKIIEIGKEKAENIQGLEKEILKLTEGEEALKYIEVVRNEIEKINTLSNELKVQFEDEKKRKKQISESVLSLEQNKKTLTNLKLEQEEKLKVLLEENKFDDKEEVLSKIIKEDEIKNIERKIKEFEEDIIKTHDNIERIEKKLNNERIEDDIWLELKERKVEVDKLLNDIIKKVAAKQKTIDDMKKDLEELKELNKKEQQIEHKLSLLSDLDKLVQGNRFVEFASMNQLRYIAREASKRLKEITNNRYALEIDDEGNFTIRDDKNGGVVRETSSLSGGETFVTSLALALALSSQIQLKGSAPLEFFFLDEGFGSLDSNLLEVVMSSLEKLHTDKLSVGIISHVDELKNRVPVKLIITPSEPGEGGSKVKLEYS